MMIAKLVIRQRNGPVMYQQFVDARSGNLPRMGTDDKGALWVQGVPVPITCAVEIEVTFADNYREAAGRVGFWYA